jgi:hypothetical protein
MTNEWKDVILTINYKYPRYKVMGTCEYLKLVGSHVLCTS